MKMKKFTVKQQSVRLHSWSCCKSLYVHFLCFSHSFNCSLCLALDECDSVLCVWWVLLMKCPFSLFCVYMTCICEYVRVCLCVRFKCGVLFSPIQFIHICLFSSHELCSDCYVSQLIYAMIRMDQCVMEHIVLAGWLTEYTMYLRWYIIAHIHGMQMCLCVLCKIAILLTSFFDYMTVLVRIWTLSAHSISKIFIHKLQRFAETKIRSSRLLCTHLSFFFACGPFYKGFFLKNSKK